MRNTIYLLVILTTLSPISRLQAQPANAPMFGKDIVIHDMPDRNQQNVAVCSAFNGWLYAAYTYYYDQSSWLAILKSEDSGESWTLFLDTQVPWDHTGYVSNDLLVCGNSLTTLKLFSATCVYDSVTTNYIPNVARINAITGEFEDAIFKDLSNEIRDIAIASDYPYPASNSDPYSIAVIYSKKNIFDSVIVLTSSNGGYSFDGKQNVAGTLNYFGKVDIAYGRSSTYSGGRYYAAWEKKDTDISATGSVYTSHSSTSFNSQFTSPVKLDDLDSALSGHLTFPSIACQVSDFDNDSNNLSEVILCQNFNSSGNNFDLAWFYNKNSTTADSFQYISFASGAGDQIQPDLSFNPYDSTFMATWYDAETQKLPFAILHVNLPDPYSWNIISEGYNDSADLLNPEPKVVLDHAKHSGMDVWSGLGANNHGVALFDAPYIYYTAINEFTSPQSLSIEIFPNPGQNIIHVKLPDQSKGLFEISIVTALGQQSGVRLYRYFGEDETEAILDISALIPGLYFCIVRQENIIYSGKLVISR